MQHSYPVQTDKDLADKSIATVLNYVSDNINISHIDGKYKMVLDGVNWEGDFITYIVTFDTIDEVNQNLTEYESMKKMSDFI